MLIPIMFVRDVQEAIAFYTNVLDFALAYAWPDENPFYAGLTRDADELHLNLASPQVRRGPASAIVVCDDVDAAFAAFKRRGFSVPVRPESPVHEGPIDQSWGTREVYIDDPSGNTIVFQQR